jgi:hypothetical protein
MHLELKMGQHSLVVPIPLLKSLKILKIKTNTSRKREKINLVLIIYIILSFVGKRRKYTNGLIDCATT